MKTRIIVLTFLMVVTASFQVYAEDVAKLDVINKTIDIGTFYNGTTLKASGYIPEGSEAVLRFTGKPSELQMKEKGKAMGLLWMNLNSIVFRNVPEVFLVSSSGAFSGSAENSGTMNKIGLSSLKDSIGVEAEKTDKVLAISELLKLKQQEGLYRETSGNISYTAAKGGQKPFYAEIQVPSRLVPGEYTLELSAVRDGQIISSASQPVSASFSGFPRLMSSIAFGNPLLYGILATVIAILSGLVIGMVFQSKGAH